MTHMFLPDSGLLALVQFYRVGDSSPALQRLLPHLTALLNARLYLWVVFSAKRRERENESVGEGGGGIGVYLTAS